jgi:hypothetical protein
MSAAGVSVAMLASVLSFAVLSRFQARRLQGCRQASQAGCRAGAPVRAGRLAEAGDGISLPNAVSIGLLLSGQGDTWTSAAMAPAHGGEAGVRMTARGQHAGSGRPVFGLWKPVLAGRVLPSRR